MRSMIIGGNLRLFRWLLLVVSISLSHAASDVSWRVADMMEAWNGIGLTAWSVDEDANLCALGVTGERILDSDEPLVTTGDSRHHVGSVTKSMTGTLLAILIHREELIPDGWDATLDAWLPEVTSTPYANVTLRHLVSNVAGIPPAPLSFDNFPAFDENDTRSFRWALAVAAIRSTPSVPPGTAYVYSNWAFITAGYIIEEVTNMTWEEALARFLFEPLGIDLGDDPLEYVGSPNNARDPWGHLHQTPCNPSEDDCDNPLVIGPAGTFSGPVAAMARYLAWHVACHNGKHTSLLSQDACQEIHRSPFPSEAIVTGTAWSYGYGWICYEDHEDIEGLVCSHNGSNLRNYYNATLVFDRNRAYVGYANAASAPDASNAQMVNEMVGTLIAMDGNETHECHAPFESTVYLPSDEPTMAPTPSGTIDGTESPSSAGMRWSLLCNLSIAASLLYQMNPF